MRVGNGKMAQFNHPEYGGTGQWMPGMTMVGDMFNAAMKGRVEGLFAALTRVSIASDEEPLAPPTWYPASLGTPAMVGGQNNMRYAVFPNGRRLCVEADGVVTVLDTGEHHIAGVMQQQDNGSCSLHFRSQLGVGRVSDFRPVPIR